MSNNASKLSSRNIRNGISQIEKLSLDSIDEQSISMIISEMIKGYKSQVPAYKEPLTVYRARICDKPQLISELSYPPNELVKEYGRGNVIGQSIFYCATHSSVPFYELKCEVGDKLALSTWRSKPGLVLNHIGFTEEVKEKLKSNRKLDEIYDFVNETNNFNDLNEMVHAYLGYLFSRPIPEGEEVLYYKVTSVLANIMMQADIINGLIYPTVQMRGNADNILLKPEYVDKHMEFVNVEYIHINEAKDNSFSIDRVDSATAKTLQNNKITWSGRPLQWELNKSGMAATFEYEKDGTWVAKGENGNIIEPV